MGENQEAFHRLPLRCSSAHKVCLIATLVWGLAAHGFALTNKLCMGDDLHFLFGVGFTLESGRWFLEVLGRVTAWFFGTSNYSLPLSGGLLSILFSGLCSCILVSWMGLSRKSSWVLVSGILIAFPVMSGLFLYNFTMPYYLFGLVLLFLGGDILCRRRGVGAFAAGVTLGVLCTSIYQAFLPLFLSLLLIYFLREVLRAETWEPRRLFREIAWYCGACIAIALLYIVSTKLAVILFGQTLSDYKGAASFGTGSPLEFLQRLKSAVYLFLFPKKSARQEYVLYGNLLVFYYLCLAALAALGVFTLVRSFRQAPLKGVTLLLVFAFFPLASNFIYVMCPLDTVYALMQYGFMAPFLLLVCLVDWQFDLLRPAFRKTAPVLLSVFCLICVRTDNAIYTRAYFAQTRSQAYFTTLTAQIKSTPGYTAATPVAYIGDVAAFTDPTFQSLQEFGSLPMAPLPYDGSPFHVIFSCYDWQEFLNVWCGFNPPQADSSAFASLPEVQQMPCYPDAGSIRMVGETLVVKFLPINPVN